MSKGRKPDGRRKPDLAKGTIEQSSSPAQKIIHAFGGIRPMANKLGVAVSTVQGWRERNSIPANRHDEILSVAKRAGIKLETEVLRASDEASPKPTPPASPTKDTTDPKDEARQSAARSSIASSSSTTSHKTGPQVRSDQAKDAGPGGPKPTEPTKLDKSKPLPSKQQSEAKPSGSKSPPTRTPPPPPAQSGGSGWLTGFLLGAAIFAAGIILAVVTRDSWLPLVGGDNQQAVDAAQEKNLEELRQQVSDLQAQIADMPSDEPGVSQDALDEGLGSLEAALGELREQVDAVSARVETPAPTIDLGPLEAIDADLSQRLDELESSLAKASTSESEGGGAVALAGMEQRLNQLAKAVAEAGEASGSGDEALNALFDEVGVRLDSLESSLAERETAAAVDSLKAEVEGRLAQAETVLADLQALTGLATETKSLASETQGLATRLGEAETQLATLTELNTRVQELEDTSAQPPSGAAGAAALTLALAQLRDALRSTGPFEQELGVVSRLAADEPQLLEALAPLSDTADTGVPTLEQLQSSFTAVARQAAAAASSGEDDGWTGGVMRRLSNVLTVRPVGEVAGEDAGAVIARAEVKLHGGDLAGAEQELSGLSGPAGEAVNDWRSQANLRLAADAALAALREHSIARLLPDGG